MFESGIPGYWAWWRNSSAGLSVKRSNPHLLDLDQKVRAYEEVMRRRPPLQKRYECLVELMESVEVYLSSKGGAHSQHRTLAATALRDAVRKELTKIRWQKQRDLFGGGKDLKRGRAMDPQYWSEFHDLQHTAAGEGGEWAIWQAELRGDPENTPRFLFQHLRNARAALGAPGSIVYVEDEERWQYNIAFDDAGKMYMHPLFSQKEISVKSIPFCTQSNPSKTTIYAMDTDGNLYVDNGGTKKPLNHCSFLRGNPVLCAGEIGVNMGVLEYIDTGSGHYKPKTRNLVRALDALDNREVQLTGVLARVFDKTPPEAVYDAKKFRLTRGNSIIKGYIRSGANYKTATLFPDAQAAMRWASKID